MKFQTTAFAFVAALATAAADGNVTLVKDIFLGEASSNPIGLTYFDGKVYFAASSEGSGVELYVSDGESAGTTMLKDIFPGESGSNPSDFTVFKDQLFFRANDGVNGAELWVTDGTPAGTLLFADINPGAPPSNPSDFVVVGDLMVFEATTVNFGKELWVTDGTVPGTKLLGDIRAGQGSSTPSLRSEYVISSNTTLFTADDGLFGEALYSTDGSSITYLTNITSDAAEIVVARPQVDDVSEIYFSIGSTFWVTDGTMAGTKILKEGVAVGGPSRISPYILGGKTHFFGIADGSSVDSLWETDGTSAGTNILLSALSSSEVSRRGSSTTVGLGFGPVLNGKMSLITDNGIGVDIWVTDGQTVDLLIDETFDWVLDAELAMSKEQVLFQVKSSNVNGTALDLWTSDYTALNTALLYSFPGGVATSGGEAVPINDNEAVFAVDTPETGVELWRMEFPVLLTAPISPTAPTRQPVSLPTRAPVASPTPAPIPLVRSPATRVTALGLVALIAGVGSLLSVL